MPTEGHVVNGELASHLAVLAVLRRGRVLRVHDGGCVVVRGGFVSGGLEGSRFVMLVKMRGQKT
jgi:hypothetical protein